MFSSNLPRRPIPICSYCGRIRGAEGIWKEGPPLSESTEMLLSHGICPTCYDTQVRPQLEELAQIASSPANWDAKGK